MKKRRSRRIPRRIQAAFGVAGQKTRVGFTSNLSATGLFIGASRPYPVGTRVKVKLLLDKPLAFGLTLGEWQDRRRDRLLGPEWIRVSISAIEATASGGDRATLTFEQSYETPTYRDRVRKSLELVREEEVWKIAAERTEG